MYYFNLLAYTNIKAEAIPIFENQKNYAEWEDHPDLIAVKYAYDCTPMAYYRTPFTAYTNFKLENVSKEVYTFLSAIRYSFLNDPESTTVNGENIYDWTEKFNSHILAEIDRFYESEKTRLPVEYIDILVELVRCIGLARTKGVLIWELASSCELASS